MRVLRSHLVVAVVQCESYICIGTNGFLLQSVYSNIETQLSFVLSYNGVPL